MKITFSCVHILNERGDSSPTQLWRQNDVKHSIDWQRIVVEYGRKILERDGDERWSIKVLMDCCIVEVQKKFSAILS